VWRGANENVPGVLAKMWKLKMGTLKKWAGKLLVLICCSCFRNVVFFWVKIKLWLVKWQKMEVPSVNPWVKKFGGVILSEGAGINGL